jgi:DNA-binding NarL/FixJ family response regulator
LEEIKIILVDDHKILVSGLSAELSKAENLCVAAEITDASLLDSAVNKYAPDVIVMDIRLGKYNGLDLTKTIKSKYPNIKIILFSGHNLGWMAKECGADAFFSKEESLSSLIGTILKVCTDESLVFPRKNAATTLTKTELQVLQLISEDKTRAEISKTLLITEKTVTNHLTSILYKLGARTRVGAIVKGMEMGLIVTNATRS